MSPESTRRAFLKNVSASAAALSSLHADGRGWLFAEGTAQRWADLPRLDGTLLLDEAPREELATDLGGHYHRLPVAVLRPRSAKDVARIVRFANTHRLRIAMRGQGHSQYGQTLVEGGIVIDSRTLKAVHLSDARTANAQAGASWDDVTQATLTQGLTPPAMGDTMTLSVGGILSAGGVSNSSHLFGAVVDNVEELDVVTGAGDLVTCSAQRNRELFELALGGMGQCGLIVGARLRLVPAPKWVVRRDLEYDDLKTFLSDFRRLASEGGVEHLGAYVLPWDERLGWRFRINIGKFCTSPEHVDFAGLEAGLRFTSQADPAPLAYADYLHRETSRIAAADAARKASPSRLLFLTMFVPTSVADEFLAGMLATPADTARVTRFSLYLLSRRRCARPMFVLPHEESALAIFLFRGVPVVERSGYSESVATVRGLAEKMRAVQGKAYPPYAPFFARPDWEAQYGPANWHRLVTGKKRFDPGGVLTPGTGMFTAERSEPVRMGTRVGP